MTANARDASNSLDVQCIQLEDVAGRLVDVVQQQRQGPPPGRGRPDEEYYLARLSADAEKRALDALKEEVSLSIQ